MICSRFQVVLSLTEKVLHFSAIQSALQTFSQLKLFQDTRYYNLSSWYHSNLSWEFCCLPGKR